MKKPIDIVILRLPQVVKQTGLPKSTIYKYMEDGTFPRPIKLGPRTSGWLLHEIGDWITRRIARRDGKKVSI